MKKFVTMLLLTFSFQGCLSDSRLTSKDFNARAKQFFLANLNQFDLAPLDEVEKCILQETITKDLDSLRDSPLVLLYDRYIVKHYRQPFLELSFAFVEDIREKTFHFFCLPELYKWQYGISDIYELGPNNLFKLKGPRDAIRLHVPLIKNFISLSDLQVNMNRLKDDAKIAVLQSLIKYSFPELGCSSIEVYSFEKEMKESLELGWISESSYENIIKTLEKNSSSKFVVTDVYFVKGFGYLLFHYSQNKTTSQLDFDIFYIPEQERGFLSRAQPYNYDYPNCK